MSNEIQTPEIDLDQDLVEAFGNISPSECVMEIVDLDESDLEELRSRGTSESMSTVENMRIMHNLIALKLACGARPTYIAAELGLSLATLTRLQRSPRFKELVAGHQSKISEQHLEQVELMSMVNGEAVEVLYRRLMGAETRDEISVESLRRIIETFSDRTGLSPVRRSQNLNVIAHTGLSQSQIAEIRTLHSEEVRYNSEQDGEPQTLEISEPSPIHFDPVRSISEILQSTQKAEDEQNAEKRPSV